MITAVETIQNEYAVIKLGTGEVISRSATGEHCRYPFVNADILLYCTCGAKANFIVRNLVTGVEAVKNLSQICAAPKYFGSTNYVTVGFRTFQGLLVYEPKDVVGMLYDMNSKTFVSAQVPYRMEQPYEHLFFLKNGDITAPPPSEAGIITSVRAIAEGQIEWSQRNENTQNQAESYVKMSRKMLADGSVIDVGIQEIFRVTNPSIQVPSWV